MNIKWCNLFFIFLLAYYRFNIYQKILIWWYVYQCKKAFKLSTIILIISIHYLYFLLNLFWFFFFHTKHNFSRWLWLWSPLIKHLFRHLPIRKYCVKSVDTIIYVVRLNYCSKELIFPRIIMWFLGYFPANLVLFFCFWAIYHC